VLRSSWQRLSNCETYISTSEFFFCLLIPLWHTRDCSCKMLGWGKARVHLVTYLYCDTPFVADGSQTLSDAWRKNTNINVRERENRFKETYRFCTLQQLGEINIMLQRPVALCIQLCVPLLAVCVQLQLISTRLRHFIMYHCMFLLNWPNRCTSCYFLLLFIS
jgi:hypothetical protein